MCIQPVLCVGARFSFIVFEYIPSSLLALVFAFSLPRSVGSRSSLSADVSERSLFLSDQQGVFSFISTASDKCFRCHAIWKKYLRTKNTADRIATKYRARSKATHQFLGERCLKILIVTFSSWRLWNIFSYLWSSALFNNILPRRVFRP